MKTPLLALTTVGISFFASQLNARPEGPPPRPDPETMVVEMFADYDADENNLLSLDELGAALTGIREKHQEGRKGDRPMKSDNGKGKRQGPPAPEVLAARLIEDFDASGDGSLDTTEALEALQGMHQRGPGGPGGRGPRANADTQDAE